MKNILKMLLGVAIGIIISIIVIFILFRNGVLFTSKDVLYNEKDANNIILDNNNETKEEIDTNNEKLDTNEIYSGENEQLGDVNNESVEQIDEEIKNSILNMDDKNLIQFKNLKIDQSIEIELNNQKVVLELKIFSYCTNSFGQEYGYRVFLKNEENENYFEGRAVVQDIFGAIPAICEGDFYEDMVPRDNLNNIFAGKIKDAVTEKEYLIIYNGDATDWGDVTYGGIEFGIFDENCKLLKKYHINLSEYENLFGESYLEMVGLVPQNYDIEIPSDLIPKSRIAILDGKIYEVFVENLEW